MRLSHGTARDLTRNLPLAVLLVPQGHAGELPGGSLARRAALLLKGKVFQGKARESLWLHAEGAEGKGAGAGPRSLLLLGLGRAGEVTTADLRRAGLICGARAAERKARQVVVAAAGEWPLGERGLGALAEGLLLSSYRYRLKKVDSPPPAEVKVVASVKGAAALLAATAKVVAGVNLARDLGDLPGNIATPRHLRDVARSVCAAGKLRFKAHDKAALQRMKMGGILAVAQGSHQPCYLIEMEYKPARYSQTVCVVGKGLTFDSGGISIKPASGMEEMKYDMCGAAATIGLMQAVAASRPQGVRVIGIVGTAENMPGGGAYKPGDVVTTGSGKTIEVINTDAEGRVVLADALHLATRFKPDAIIDLATLTGAIVVALGHEAAGLFCKDESLQQKLLAASQRSDEKLWPMPTFPAYSEAVKSKWADVRNSTGRDGGSCTAAAFLGTFTEGFKHAHLDVAGTAWETGEREDHPAGARGFGVRLLHDALLRWNDRG